MKAALGAQSQYGVEDAKTADDLEGYHYTFGMEYFDEPYELTITVAKKKRLQRLKKV